MRKYVMVLILLLSITRCSAQQQINTREILPPPDIKVTNLKDSESEIKLSEVKIGVKVIGSMAVTTLDMIFYNPNDRILEGEFNFPLGEGQNISRFALDIDGKLREGVVVEKAKGQEVFESTIRQNVDPGLLEKTQGNNFRARIYPLPAKGTRRIVIAYEEELQKDKDSYQVFLPTEYNETLDLFNLDVWVMGNDIEPQINHSPWGSFSFNKSNDAYIASYSAEKYLAKGQLVFSVPQKKDEHVFIEKGNISGETVFFGQVYPRVVFETKEKVSTIALFWDASLSMKDRALDMELQFIEGYLTSLGNVRVDLHTFNCLPMPVRSFTIKNGNSQELLTYLSKIPHDGATQLGILDFKDLDVKEILLLSDALSNFGKSIPTIGSIPVNTISSSLKADHSMLKYLASTTGGTYINLMQDQVSEAIPMLLKNSYRFISSEYNKTEIKDFTTSIGSITNEKSFSFAGKLLTNQAKITLNFGIGDKILDREVIIIDGSQLKDYDNIVERVWAEKKIMELDMLYDKNKLEIENLGKMYNIVTRNTSLIVLDRVEDYFEHKITPPKELLGEYNKMVAHEKEEKYDSKKKQIDHVVSMFKQRKNWWMRDFPKKKSKLPQKIDPDDQISIANITVEEDIVAYDVAETQDHREVLADQAYYSGQVNEDIAMESEAQMHQIEMAKVKPNPRRNKNISHIVLKNWDPNTPYLNILKTRSNKELYDTYIELSDKYRSSPAFYLDVATLFEERGLKREALIILSNLAELEIENYRMLRVLAHRLYQLGYLEYSIDQFEAVLKLRPEEPQSYRDLASVYAEDKQYQQAMKNIYKIIETSWDSRFPEIELIAAEEMNRIMNKAINEKVDLPMDQIDKRLISNMPVDIRIVLNWDTDNSDMDLWVTDPYGEKCFYGNSLTRIGGVISRDFTSGYGPEEFLIKEAVNGTYKIQANYYSSREQTLLGPTTIYLDIYTHYADRNEKKETITLRLTEQKEVIDIGEITFED